MARRREVKVEIVGDASDFKRAANQAETAAGGLGSKLQTGLGSKLDDIAKKVPILGGAMNTLGISGGAMGSMIATGAAAAGAAIAAFAVKGVADFQKLALEAGAFADATGTSVEDASRLLEVGSDLGIGAEALQSAILRMNNGIASGKLDDFAADVVRAKDGTVDAAASFQRLVTKIGAIPDPTKRAEAAQQAFGRSYGQIAELMEMDAESLQRALAGVSDAKVIDEAELQKARDFRAAMDELQDRIGDVALKIGGALVPAVTSLVELVAPAAEGLGALAEKAQQAEEKGGGFFGDLKENMSWWAKNIWEGRSASEAFSTALDANGLAMLALDGHTRGMGERAKTFTGAMGGAADETYRLASNSAIAARAAADLKGAYDRLLGRLDAREAMINMQNDFATLKTKAWEAWDAAARGAADAKAKSDAYALANIALQKEVVNYQDKLGQLPIAKVTQITSLIDQGSLDRAEALLRIITRNRTMNIDIVTRGGPGYGGRTGAFADGGPIPGPRGQAVPITAHGGEFVLSANVVDAIRKGNPTSGLSASAAAPSGVGAAGGVVNVYVQVAGTVVAERELVDVVHEGLLLKQRSGATLGFRGQS